MSKPRTFQRFSLLRRAEHLVMLLSFSTLGLTGLPQKFPNASLSVWLVNLLGGIESLRTIHHTGAVVMMVGTAWHILVAGYHLFVLRSQMSMLPALKDARDGWNAFLFNLGVARKYPQMGRYTFEEKLEYWAFAWGALIMGFTGFLMWNPITATRFLPGEWVPAAKAAHGGEAVLAVLAIIIWHMYGVHLKRFNKAMWTGTQTEAEMLHEHPLELADLKAGIAGQRPDPLTIRKRQRIYYPAAALFTVVMLGGIYGFVNAEETALTTLPAQDRLDVFVAWTPTPAPTASPTVTVEAANQTSVIAAPLSWEGDVSELMQVNCVACHGSSGMAGLDLSSYAMAMQGGASGPAIVPGDPNASLLVVRQEAGGHAVQLTTEKLDLIIAWIQAGAPER